MSKEGGNGSSDWPIAAFLIVATLCVTAICLMALWKK